MIITADNTETRLLQHLKQLYRATPQQYCFHLACATLAHPKKQIFKAITDVMQTMPQSHMAHVFLCENTDIFLTLSSWNIDIFSAFAEKVANYLKDDRIMQVIITYDIWLDWEQLEQDIKSKISVIKEQKEREELLKQQEESRRFSEELHELLDPGLIASLYSRREERDRPLIMVVDDDQICRTLATNALDSNCSTVIASNGKDALRLYIERAPDILFLDIGLPDINGHDLLKCLFTFDEEAHIIMFSGQKNRDNVLRALELGARGFVGKPFTRANIINYVYQAPQVQQKLSKVA